MCNVFLTKMIFKNPEVSFVMSFKVVGMSQGLSQGLSPGFSFLINAMLAQVDVLISSKNFPEKKGDDLL